MRKNEKKREKKEGVKIHEGRKGGRDWGRMAERERGREVRKLERGWN